MRAVEAEESATTPKKTMVEAEAVAARLASILQGCAAAGENSLLRLRPHWRHHLASTLHYALTRRCGWRWGMGCTGMSKKCRRDVCRVLTHATLTRERQGGESLPMFGHLPPVHLLWGEGMPGHRHLCLHCPILRCHHTLFCLYLACRRPEMNK